MWRAGVRVWSPLLGACLMLVGCSKSTTTSERPNTGSSAGSYSPPTGGKGGASSSSSAGSLSTDNPDGIVPTLPDTPPATMMPTAMNDEDAGMCKEGKFCEPKGPDGDCGSERVDTDLKQVQKPGNVLVVYDRSGSMDGDWNGMPKYQAAGNAIISALTPLKDLLTIGGVFFPSVDPNSCPCNVADPTHWIPGPQACCLNSVANSCFVSDIMQSDQIKFGTGQAYIDALPMQWRLQMANGTPLQAGVQRAAEALAATTLDGPVAVILMTDGEPNCNTDVNAVTTQVQMWKDKQIPTYVIGLPGAQEAADILNTIAMTGGTDKYVDPTNAMELEAKIRAILTSTIRQGFDSCTFHLDMATMVPEKLHLVITEGGKDKDVPRDLSSQPNWGKDAGWNINKDGSTVELTGRLCDLAKEGAYESVRFDYGCVDLPPPEPPIGPA